MGQHKYNPNVIAKQNGEILPEKPKKMSKRETERYIKNRIYEYMLEKGIPPELIELSDKYSKDFKY